MSSWCIDDPVPVFILPAEVETIEDALAMYLLMFGREQLYKWTEELEAAFLTAVACRFDLHPSPSGKIFYATVDKFRDMLNRRNT